ncbi:hypothetical protein [Segeticoccus rhizosphaerae]|uniref:hypothetical protein n=1 Tax=Segeticoccus rhizosphaerae TaxID=1104777 RepID=UPI001EF0C502|nr:hypothetical protein [Segeticoccus rhizosphaerae]
MAEKQRQRQAAAAVREQARLQREVERAQRASDRARAQAGRQEARDLAAAEKEAKRAHIDAQEARAEAMNAELKDLLAEIDGLLAATLEVDDYVDLNDLRQGYDHPAFTSKYEERIPAPEPIAAPPEPVFTPPEPLKGMSALFGKKKHAAEVQAARAEFDRTQASWREEVGHIPARQLAQLTAHQEAEQERKARLAADRERYERESREREAKVDEQNAELDELIAGLARGEASAVDLYVDIVLGNSVYPEGIHVGVEHEFDDSAKEIRLTMSIPQPAQLPTVREYKYVKAKDEIVGAHQTLKEQRERYTHFLSSVALRTLHEVWEADRDGKVQSISLVVGVDHIDPALGVETVTPLLAVAVPRDDFLKIDLSRATPMESLKYLKASVSKDPHGLKPVQELPGVKG